MIACNAHFDGKVIVPEHAVDLPRDRPFVVHIEGLVDPDSGPENAPTDALKVARRKRR